MNPTTKQPADISRQWRAYIFPTEIRVSLINAAAVQHPGERIAAVSAAIKNAKKQCPHLFKLNKD